MRLVILESPLAGNVERNTAYARAALLDSIRRGEAPFASHLLYPQVLDDLDPEQRLAGITAGLEWAAKADATVVYHDLGVSSGMQQGIRHAIEANRPVEWRQLGGVWAGLRRVV